MLILWETQARSWINVLSVSWALWRRGTSARDRTVDRNNGAGNFSLISDQWFTRINIIFLNQELRYLDHEGGELYAITLEMHRCNRQFRCWNRLDWEDQMSSVSSLHTVTAFCKDSEGSGFRWTQTPDWFAQSSVTSRPELDTSSLQLSMSWVMSEVKHCDGRWWVGGWA